MSPERVLLLLAVFLAGGASAQAHRQPTPDEEKQAQERHRTPTGLELGKWAQSTPRLDVVPQSVDIESLARDYDKLRVQRVPDVSGPALYVFVTLAMPDASLKALMPQAEKSGATLVVRGLLDRSIRKTAEAVQKLIGQHHVGWLIDPESFGRYQVTVAPTVVLDLAPKAPGCDADASSCPAARFAKVAGDVRLAYALKRIRDGSPQFAAATERYLQRLGE